MRKLDVTKREEELKRKACTFGLFLLLGATAIGTVEYFHDLNSKVVEFSTEDSSLKDLLDLIQKKMKKNPYYLQEIGSESVYSDLYLEKLEPFLTLYYPYLGDEQIATLLYFVETQFPTYDLSDSYKDGVEEAWNNFLGRMVSREFSGHGLRESMFAVSEDTRAGSYHERYEGASHELFTLFEVIMEDVIFESDEEKMVDVICKETSIDEEKARRLIQLFDLYYEYQTTGTKEGYALCPDLVDEMKMILTSMIEAKNESDPEFSHSVIGYILNHSKYVSEDDLTFEINRFDNDGTFLFEMDLGDYKKTTVTLPMYYLNAHMDPETIVDSAACYIIHYGYGAAGYDHRNKALELLSYIVGWNHIDYLAEFDGSSNQIKNRYYQSLNQYFSSEEEFNQFLIALNSSHDDAIEKYFSIWKSQMMNGPVTFRKLLEYNSLRESITSWCSAHYSDYDEAVCITEKGPDLGEMYEIDDFYFYPSEYDYMPAFDEVLDYFHAQDSSYTELISENGYLSRDWKTGRRRVDIDCTFVLSQPLSVQKKEIGDGHTIYYYVKPEDCGEGSFVYAFTNVLNQRVETPILGISTMLENEETGEMEEVMIVSLDEEEPYGEAYYKSNYLKDHPKELEYCFSW